MRINALVRPLALSLLAALSFFVTGAELDQGIPEYERTSGVSGNLSSVGSDTLANLMTLWAEDFKRVYPNVNIQIQANISDIAK